MTQKDCLPQIELQSFGCSTEMLSAAIFIIIFRTVNSQANGKGRLTAARLHAPVRLHMVQVVKTYREVIGVTFGLTLSYQLIPVRNLSVFISSHD